MPISPRRFFAVSADCTATVGFDTLEGAEGAAMSFGEGAHVIDTFGKPYTPTVMRLEAGSLVYVGFGQFDQRRGMESNLIEAARKGVLPAVHAYLAKGADPNGTDRKGATALHWAAALGREEIVAALLKAGADPAQADRNGDTAMDLAAKRQRAEVVEVLKAA